MIERRERKKNKVVRIRDNISSSDSHHTHNNRWFTPDEAQSLIRQNFDRVQHIIDVSMERYDKTGDLNALKLASDCHISLAGMLRQVQELYSYGHNFELTK